MKVVTIYPGNRRDAARRVPAEDFADQFWIWAFDGRYAGMHIGGARSGEVDRLAYMPPLLRAVTIWIGSECGGSGATLDADDLETIMDAVRASWPEREEVTP